MSFVFKLIRPILSCHCFYCSIHFFHGYVAYATDSSFKPGRGRRRGRPGRGAHVRGAAARGPGERRHRSCSSGASFSVESSSWLVHCPTPDTSDTTLISTRFSRTFLNWSFRDGSKRFEACFRLQAFTVRTTLVTHEMCKSPQRSLSCIRAA